MPAVQRLIILITTQIKTCSSICLNVLEFCLSENAF